MNPLRLEDAVQSTLARLMRNYRVAVPAYANREIQFLAPLCLKAAFKADLALVVGRHKGGYAVTAVLPLDVAYRYARLLGQPDDEWLVP